MKRRGNAGARASWSLTGAYRGGSPLNILGFFQRKNFSFFAKQKTAGLNYVDLVGPGGEHKGVTRQVKRGTLPANKRGLTPDVFNGWKWGSLPKVFSTPDANGANSPLGKKG